MLEKCAEKAGGRKEASGKNWNSGERETEGNQMKKWKDGPDGKMRRVDRDRGNKQVPLQGGREIPFQHIQLA